MRLEKTYNTTDVHSKWQSAYHSGSLQARFDDTIYDWLADTLHPVGHWIDAGCGTGDLAFRLAELGYRVTGVDVSANALETARIAAAQHPNGHLTSFRQATLEQLAEADLEKGHVHCRGVLMHVPEWKTALENLTNCVQPGGYLVIFESNSRSIEGLIVRLMRLITSTKSQLRMSDDGWEFWSSYQGSPFLVRMFHLHVLRSAVVSQGFEMVKERPLFVLDPLRIPPSVRPICVALNRLWFLLRLPFASGKILIFKRRDA